MLKLLLLLGLSLLAVPLLPQPTSAQALDPTFTPPTGLYAPGAVYSMTAQQADGKRVVAGYFTRVNNTQVGSLVRLDAAGALDADFAQKVGVARNAYRVKALPSGQYLVSGFSNEAVTAGGLTRPALLRLNANGTADATFNAGTGPSSTSGVQLNTFVAQPDGKVLVGGDFTSFSGQSVGRLVRLTTTGALDAAFNANIGTGFDQPISTVVLQPDGKILVGGTFTTFKGQMTSPLLRLNADGTLDNTFSSDLPFNISLVATVLVQPDSKILVAGVLGAAGIMRLTATGRVDTSFAAPAYVTNYSASNLDTGIQLQPDGKIIFSGTFNPGTTAYIIRLNPDGSADTSFDTGPNATLYYIHAIALQSDGSLWIGGNFRFLNNQEVALSRLTSTGAVDATFMPKFQIPGYVTALARQADGQLLAGGYFSEFSGVPAHNLVRLSATGTPDAAFTTTAQVTLGRVNDLALQPDGKLLVGTVSGVQRLLPNGSADASYSTFTVNNYINKLTVQPDGKTLAVGSFSSIAGSTSTQLIRLSTDGEYDTSFSFVTAHVPGTPGIGYLSAMALQPDGKVLVASSFLTNAGNWVARVVRYGSTGTTDPLFDSTTTFGLAATVTGDNTQLNTLTLQPDGKVLAGGYFATVNGTARTNLARLTTTGQPDATFAPTTLSTEAVTAVALQADGHVLVSSGYGSYSSYGGSIRPTSLVRLLSTGASDPSFGTSATPDNSVAALLVQPNGAVVMGGIFNTIGGQASPGLARLSPPGPLAAAAPAAATFSAWPVPAHALLHVATQADAQAAELLDALGRVVRQQPLHGASQFTLATDNLPAGVYLLRVRYASGTVARRVAVE